MLISLLCSGTPQQSHADEYTYQDKATAVRIYNDLATCKENYPLLQEAVKLQQEKIQGLQKDKEEYKSEVAKLEDLAKQESKARQEAEQDKPSRTTWALIGSIITAVVFGSLIAMIKK